MRFQQKTVLVTGAAGGMGRAIASRFAAEGARVVLTDLSAEALSDVASQLSGEGHITLAGNLMDGDYCQRLVDAAVQETGRLDIVVNNAGCMHRGTVLETTDDMWDLSIGINVTAVFKLCRAAITQMKVQGGGAIVNTASTWGVYPGPGHAAYCTSKAAVAALSKCLGRDHAADNIRVNAVCPNEVNTPMLRTGFERRGLDPERAIEQLNQTVPLGRVAEPEDIADVVLFLASEEARYVAGTTLEVSGAKPVY